MQDQMDEDQRAHEEMREQYGIQERKLTIVMTELEETRNALESNERSRKQAEAELLEVTDRVNNLSAQNSALSSARRKLETENEQMRSELDEAVAECKASDERAKKAVSDVSWLLSFFLTKFSALFYLTIFLKFLKYYFKSFYLFFFTFTQNKNILTFVLIGIFYLTTLFKTVKIFKNLTRLHMNI